MRRTPNELFAVFSAIVTACGSGGTGADPLDGGGASSSSTSASSSSGASGTSSTSSSSGSTGSCGTPPPPEVFTVAYQPRTDCIEDAGADAEIVDGGPDAACEGEEPKFSMCQRNCSRGGGGVGGADCELSKDGKMVTCTVMHPCGRRFEGLAAHGSEGGDLGDFLASSAYLEAASVHAFRWMAEEIEAHDLGGDLATWARRAAREEARHARMMTSLAQTLGHPTIPKVKKPARRTRSLEAIALENAVEGCVRETYGALLATFQANHASDPRVRETFGAIAKDETSHAALAWALAEAIERRLDPAARERVHNARTRAFAELDAAVGSTSGHADRAALGHPSNVVAVRMSRALGVALAA